MSRQDSKKVSDVKVMLLKGADGTSIADIELTSSVLNVDTYAITLTDGSKFSFQVTNGVSIEDIERTGVEANVDTYTIYLSDGTTSTFTVTNGRDTHAQMAERVTSPATLAYSIGEYVTFNDLFCEVIAPIAVGDTFAIGTNLKATTVGDEITTLANNKQDGFTTGTGIQNVSNVLSIKQSDLLNLFYPVGTIYESTDNSFNPNNAWGGTWEKIEGRFLLGSSSSYTIGNTGGEATHTLSGSEMPEHRHEILSFMDDGTGTLSVWNMLVQHGSDVKKSNSYTLKTGGSQPHNNMPPYLVVNIWKRTA